MDASSRGEDPWFLLGSYVVTQVHPRARGGTERSPLTQAPSCDASLSAGRNRRVAIHRRRGLGRIRARGGTFRHLLSMAKVVDESSRAEGTPLSNPQQNQRGGASSREENPLASKRAPRNIRARWNLKVRIPQALNGTSHHAVAKRTETSPHLLGSLGSQTAALAVYGASTRTGRNRDSIAWRCILARGSQEKNTVVTSSAMRGHPRVRRKIDAFDERLTWTLVYPRVGRNHDHAGPAGCIHARREEPLLFLAARTSERVHLRMRGKISTGRRARSRPADASLQAGENPTDPVVGALTG